MKYIARVSNRNFSIEGADLIEAVGNNIMALAKEAGLGNVAGITLDSVRMDWNDGILGGKGGIDVEVTAHGSDFLVNYDPTEDAPKTAHLWVEINKSDIPNELPYEYEIGRDEKKEETPFDKPENLAQAYGYYCAICDEIAANHAKVPVKKNILGGVTTNIDQRFPTMKTVNPYKYVELVQQAVNRSYPKGDEKTKKLVEKANELALTLMDAEKADLVSAAKNGAGFFHMVHASRWFDKCNRVTALAVYRKKAGLTGKQLADMVGISDRQIRKYESADSALGSASSSVVQKLANVLNVEPSDLVDCGIVVMMSPEF